MFKSLYSKLAAVLTGLFCLVGLAIIVVTIFSTDMYQQEVNQRLNNKLADHIVAERLLMQNNRVNQGDHSGIFSRSRQGQTEARGPGTCQTVARRSCNHSRVR